MKPVCTCCGSIAAIDLREIGRRAYRAKSWAGSPAPWLGALTPNEIDALRTAELVERDAAGWVVPTALGKLAFS